METTIAACGLVCGKCPARAATLASDRDAIERIAAKWREVHNPDIQAADVWCVGCMATGGPKCGYAAHCSTRKCVVAKGHSTCADCADYPCDSVNKFAASAPHIRLVLDALRKASEAQK